MFETLDTEKATQAAAVLLRGHGGVMSHQRLLKLLYLADRQGLRQAGWPVIGFRYEMHADGPQHAELADLIHGAHPGEPYWSRHVSRQGYAIRLMEDPGVLRLSKLEIALLDQATDAHRNMSDWELVERMKALPEVPGGRGSEVQTIPYRSILAAVGHVGDDAESILAEIEDARQQERAHRALHRSMTT